MSYYMGDYYQGDYYQGDPILGGLVAMGAGFIGKKLLGGGIGAAGKSLAKKAVGILAKPATAKVIASAAGGALLSSATAPARTIEGPKMIAGGPLGKPRGGFKGAVQRFLPGGETGYLPRRRMNVTNVRALRRAIRRAEGFRKLAMRVLSFSKGKSFGGRMVKFKQGGRKR